MNQRSDGLGTVSVIVPTWNSARTIDRAIDSVVAQSYADWKLIVVDDASSDATVAHVRARQGDLAEKIVLVSCSENQGPAAARNAGLSASTGHWIAVLDADDAWQPDRLKTLLAKAYAESADAICDNLLGFDDHLRRTTEPLYGRLPPWLDIAAAVAPTYAGGFSLGYLKPIVRREFVEKHQIRYDELLRTGEDLLYLLNLLAKGARIRCLDAPLYVYTLQVGTLSRKLSRSTNSAPRDLEIAQALRVFLKDHENQLTTPEREAIGERIAYLDYIAPVARFRYARLQGEWLTASELFLKNAAVRTQLWKAVAGRIGFRR